MTTPTPTLLARIDAHYPEAAYVRLYTVPPGIDGVWLHVGAAASYQAITLTREQATTLADTLDAWLAAGLTSITRLDQETTDDHTR